MKILDSQGRLFGKVSILDFGAALVILLVLVGIFFPGTSGSVAQVGIATKPVEVDLIVRLNVATLNKVKARFKEGGKPILSAINPTVRLALNLLNSCPELCWFPNQMAHLKSCLIQEPTNFDRCF